MDTILSEFVARTSADPGLARDILIGHNWDLQEAICAYYVLKGIGSLTTSGSRQSENDASCAVKGNNADNGLASCSPTKPQLRKMDAIEIESVSDKKLTRGISRATDNVNLVSKARSEFAQDFRDEGRESSPSHLLLETPVFTFTLPDLSIQPEDFREFLKRDLIEASTLVSLEQAGRLNWWAERGACQRLWPVLTSGDGNCLLHAASLGMWGFHDRLLTLRRALHSLLSKSTYTDAFYRRWRWQTALQNKEAGLVYCEQEWLREWKNLLQMASSEPRLTSQHRSGKDTSCNRGTLDTVLEEESQPHIYESLEEIHVLALAHVLRRPVIVIADTMLKDVTGQPFAPIPFGGIYLPLECPPAECNRSPLCLTYDAAHFSALVAMEDCSKTGPADPTLAAIPLIDPDHKLLPIQFATDPGKMVRWGTDENDYIVLSKLTLTNKDKLGLLNEYLDVIEIPASPLPKLEANGHHDFLENGHIDAKKQPSGSFESDSSSDTAQSHKSRAAKQLQSVARQFGSIGKSMGKKIKKIASFKGKADRSRKNNRKKSSGTATPFPPESESSLGIVVALLRTDKRHEYQEDMIRNYLNSAKLRFEKERHRFGKKKNVSAETVRCVNTGCSMFGTAATNYLCSSCYSTQKQEAELTLKRTGKDVLVSGNSAFYAANEADEVDPVAKVPLVSRVPVRNDGTLYLAKSVFYGDAIIESPREAHIFETSTNNAGSALKISSQFANKGEDRFPQCIQSSSVN